jgi:exopolysaccharide biosynthesis polyprenyl glycosylphosphotransferase
MLRRGFAAGPHARRDDERTRVRAGVRADDDVSARLGTFAAVRRNAARRTLLRHFLTRAYGGPVAAGITAAVIARSEAGRPAAAALATVVFVAAAALAARLGRHSFVLPLMRHLRVAAGPMAGTIVLALGDAGAGTNFWGDAQLAIIFFAGLAGGTIGHRALPAVRRSGMVAKRIAVIGTSATTATIGRELDQAGIASIEVAGRIGSAADVEQLGTLDDLGRLVVEHEIDLLVLTRTASRLQVFEEMTRSCLDLPVRMIDLTSFCERTFGHVPVSEMNAAWFQYLMHPSFRRRAAIGKRAIDIAIATVAGIAFMPVLLVAAPLIRRDGGTVFFKQIRVGEGGRLFTIHKLRTMAVAPASLSSEWTTKNDPRVTRIGRFLRRSHLDELPQVLNVLKGEMSIVGPRPEQPAYVSRLERTVPFYSRRHLIKPGITGWAQIRCGYSGSVQGSAWKMCHDLYYVKHRSLGLDLLIIGETFRSLFADKQFAQEPEELSAFAVTTPSSADAALIG